MFLLYLFIILALVGGCFYGYAYLTAKADKIPVTTAIVKLLNGMFRRES